MKKIKIIICLIFGHNTYKRKKGGYCQRCNWDMEMEEYQVIKRLNKEI